MIELVWIGSAYLMGLIASRLLFPPLVGYLIAGYALHASGFTTFTAIPHIADIGIELLLFTVGLKIKPRSLIRSEVLSVGGWHLLIVTAVSALMFFWLGKQITGGLVLGVSLAFSSTVLAIKVLEDNGELSSFHGRDVLSILILQDMIAIALLAFTDGHQPTPWALELLAIPFLRPIAYRLLEASRNAELRLLLGVTMALAGGVFADYLGISADIGALLTGIMLGGHSKTEDIAHKLWSLKELFLVAFFLQIGLNDLPTQQQALTALSLLAWLPLQGGLFFFLFIMAGLRARTAFVSSLALTTYSEFALITTESVVNSGLLGPEWQPIISLAVAGSLAIAAPLNRYSHLIFNKLEPLLIRFERKKRQQHFGRIPESLGATEWLVVGMGRTGVSAYMALHAKHKRVVGLDADPTVVEIQLAKNRRVIYGDSVDTELWSGLPLNKIKGVILTLPDFDLRFSAIQQLKHRGFKGKIGTICYYSDEQVELQRLGADFVVHPLYEAGNRMADHMLNLDK
ncbi:cation:proton antiporter [Methylomonas sp. SURF-2]|uniref:Cation:proton antiporter n=1 Tax=Methylomonas subterranea TaxID=2952225 RepID=A0ABT1TB14_9GAMM|nr:cation:proton antiporter family protein [Methylomonas sp. SURF-2]MCQ8102658.1 cation:proton antiporter [Methylomonas sp. SURF-2]